MVFMTTLFALWSGIGDGLAALVIVQAETFAEASRQLVRSVLVFIVVTRLTYETGLGCSRNWSSTSTA